MVPIVVTIVTCLRMKNMYNRHTEIIFFFKIYIYNIFIVYGTNLKFSLLYNKSQMIFKDTVQRFLRNFKESNKFNTQFNLHMFS